MPAKSFLLFSLLFSPAVVRAGESLLYLEVQGVAGYSSAQKAAVYHSMSAGEPMQKSSLGFDMLRKFSGDGGDLGTLAVQGRLAWDKDASNRLEPQLYNAYYRLRTPYGYVWAGHNRAAAGLESYFDTHAALLQSLPMYGYGFERDWGLGASRDYDRGAAAFSFTTGSGMRPRAAGNYLASARVSGGVLSRDNRTVGLYASSGRVPPVSGYRVLAGREEFYSAFGGDLTLLLDRWEFRADLRAGRKQGRRYLAGLGRAGLNLLEEGRLKLEGQGVYSGIEGAEGWTLGAGASYALSAELSCRALFEYDDAMRDRRAVAQVYYYLPI